MDELYRAFGTQLRQARRAARLTQAALAERTGLSRTSIANVELGRQHFPFHALYRFAAAVGREPGELLPVWSPLSPAIPAGELDRFKLGDDETAWVHRVVQSAPNSEGGLSDGQP